MSIDGKRLAKKLAKKFWEVACSDDRVKGDIYAQDCDVLAEIALPLIVAAVTDEVRKSHPKTDAWGGRCAICLTPYPCATAKRLDGIDAAAGVGR